MQRDLRAGVPVLRVARAADAEPLRAMHRRALQSLGGDHYDARQIAALLAHLPTLDDALIDDGTYFVAEVDGELAGAGGWSARTPGYAGSIALDDRTARIRAMYTHPAHVRRGIGRAILRRAEAQARAAGHDEMRLEALLTGVALYRACNWQAAGRTVATLRDGTTLEVLQMRKRIGAV